MPPGEVSVRTSWPRSFASSLVRSEPPCTSTMRRSAPGVVRYWAISFRMLSVATPAAPPILITSVILCAPLSAPALYWMQAGEAQPQRFIPTVHTVHGLNSVAGRAFDQVVQRRHDHHAALFSVQLKADIAVIAARQDLGFGITVNPLALLDQPHKGLCLVSLAIDTPET